MHGNPLCGQYHTSPQSFQATLEQENHLILCGRCATNMHDGLPCLDLSRLLPAFSNTDQKSLRGTADCEKN